MKPRGQEIMLMNGFSQIENFGGLISLKYEFIKLKINGEDHGLYVLEESFR